MNLDNEPSALIQYAICVLAGLIAALWIVYAMPH